MPRPWTIAFAFAAALAWPIATRAMPVYSDRFSPAFRAAVDSAMEQQGPERARLLTDAMRNATDDEVFYVFPLLFKAETIKSARKANVCESELASSLSNLEAYISTDKARQDAFPREHAKKIRADTDRLIACLGTATTAP